MWRQYTNQATDTVDFLSYREDVETESVCPHKAVNIKTGINSTKKKKMYLNYYMLNSNNEFLNYIVYF